MNERLMKKSVGKPVPEWDMARRLTIDCPAGPVVQDFGTTFSINSTYMDVTDTSFLERQWYLGGGALALAGVCTGPYVYWLTEIRYPRAGGVIGDIVCVLISLIFGALAVKVLRGFVFGLRRMPIRFNRIEKKIYAVRARRYFARPGEGDVVWEASWSQDAIFCLHKEDTPFGAVFHIRHYDLDSQGNVVRVFSIGREWTSSAEVEMALAQWNYWATYMRNGANNLPRPMLYQTQQETLQETFMFSMYSFGFDTPAFLRILMMPVILLFTGLRYAANATCRGPNWPSAIEKLCAISEHDPYQEPGVGTPVGWAATVLAKNRGEYPTDPKARTENWHGIEDGERHAAAWLENPAMNKTSPVERGAQ